MIPFELWERLSRVTFARKNTDVFVLDRKLLLFKYFVAHDFGLLEMEQLT